VRNTRKKVGDFIEETIGMILHTYYAWVKFFGLRPRTLDDFVDGLLYMELYSMQQQEMMDEMRTQREQERVRAAAKRRK
jgi:hypothetical protein